VSVVVSARDASRGRTRRRTRDGDVLRRSRQAGAISISISTRVIRARWTVDGGRRRAGLIDFDFDFDFGGTTDGLTDSRANDSIGGV